MLKCLDFGSGVLLFLTYTCILDAFFFFVAVDSTPDLGAFFVCSSILLLLPLLCNENTSKKTSVVVVCFMVPLKPGKGVALMIPVAVPNLNWNANFS